MTAATLSIFIKLAAAIMLALIATVSLNAAAGEAAASDGLAAKPTLQDSVCCPLIIF